MQSVFGAENDYVAEARFTHEHSAPSPQTEGAEREIKEKKNKKKERKTTQKLDTQIGKVIKEDH